MPDGLRFAGHGSFSLERSGSVFVLDAQGPWNLETFAAYAKAAHPPVGAQLHPFGGYVAVSGEALMTPEVVPHWRRSNALLASAGLAAVAYHFLDDAGRSVYQDVFRLALGEAPFSVRFVDSRTSALSWLAELGFSPA